MNTTVEQLRAAKALIDTPEKWTKGNLKVGKPDGSFCYCILGASIGLGTNAKRLQLNQIPGLFGRSLMAFNDHPETTHTDIMALFDRAIAAAEQSEVQDA